MFDMGNALFACGGTYALVSAMPSLGSEARPDDEEFVKRVFSTVPFVVYIVALVWVTFISGVPRCIDRARGADWRGELVRCDVHDRPYDRD